MKTHHLSWALALMLLASSASATTFTVTTTADEFDTPSGADVSLREAIRDAGNAAGADTIVFNGALSGQTITLGGTELLVNHSLSIDASSLTTGITISGNNISRGFRVNSPGVLSLDSLTIINGFDNGSRGGGIINTSGATLTLNRCTLSDNVAGNFSYGGGISNNGTLSVNQSSIRNNSCYFRGGAIINFGNCTITNSTISGNTAGDQGGGIYTQSPATLSITSSTISGNISTTTHGDGFGGGILCGGPTTLIHCTISGNNAAALGGGLSLVSAGISIQNCIIAGNTAPSESDIKNYRFPTAPDVTVSGTNLVGNNSTVEAVLPAGPLVGTQASPKNPQLGPLASNGGPTQTRALLPGSPAINASVGSAVIADQRGFPINDVADIGAFESPSTNANLSALVPSAGILSPAFAAGTTAYTASVSFGTTSLTMTPTQADANATIQVRVNGGSYASVTSGTASASLPLNVGANTIDTLVTAQDGTTIKLYNLTVTRRATALPGDADSLNAMVVGTLFNTSVSAIATQPDGKVIIVGTFTQVLGVARNNVARLNADGTLDTGFNPDVSNTVHCVVVQADGKILLGGEFFFVGGTLRNRIARLEANGTLDAGFNPSPNSSVYSMAVQADGQILLGGRFTALQPNGAASPTTRNRIARLNADGTLDAGFDPNANGDVYSVAVQADGQILLGGLFSTVGGTGRGNIARVAANGTLDAGFNPNANDYVFSVTVQADGQILLGGRFTTLQPNGAASPTARSRIARVAANGTLDVGFNPNANSQVNSVTVQADGKILLGGIFTTMGGTTRNRMARVAANGTLDAGFNPNSDGMVASMAVQADGQILAGGGFTNVGGTARSLFARLLNDPATQTLSTPDTTQVTWTRGGSAPDVSQVTFELSTNGGSSYTPLGGTATRVGSTANWQLTGLSLPVSGQLRARGRTMAGFSNGSSGLVEQVQAFVFAPEMAVSGNSVEIADGDSTPSLADHTDFGNVNVVGGSLVRTFTIANIGSANLILTGTPKVVIGGTNAADFSINVLPTTPVAVAGSTTFQVTFAPSALGLRSATLSIANDDSDENPYNFSIQGTGDTFGGNLDFAPAGYSVAEGGTVTLTINRTGSTSGVVSVTIATSIVAPAPATPAMVIKDYTAKTQTLLFTNGMTSQTFEVQTLTDTLVEPNETFLVKLSTPSSGAVLGSATTARVTIIDASAFTTDVVLPAITLTAPAANALVGVNTGGSTNLVGTATDAKGVEKVEFKVLTAGGTPTAFTLATLGTPGGTSTTFTGPITPVTGLNTVEVKVTDYKGNTKSLTRIFKVTRPLQVILAGTGTVTAGFAGTSFREVGKPLTITATPGKDQVFDGWLVSNTAGTGITPLMLELPKLTFTFTEGLVLTAKFIPNPFTLARVGTFNGLALPNVSTTPGVANLGLLNLVLGTKGSFTGSLKIDGVSLSTPGFFDNAGVARFSVTTRATTLLLKRTGKPDVELALNLNMTPGSGKLTGTVTQKLVSVVQAVSNIDADRAHYSTANKVPANLAGTATKPYTLVFPAKTQSPAKALNLYPQGDGYATMTVNVNGTVSLTGKLADDAPITASAPLSQFKTWPIFAQLYALKGSIAGMAALTDANSTTEDVIGTNLQWFRPTQTVQWYPNGWPAGITVDLNGARYVVPPAAPLPVPSVFPGLLAVNATTGNATLTFTGGLLNPLPLPYNINISTANLVTNAPVAASPTMLIDKASGKITGTFIHTDGPTIKPAYQGVIIQKGSKQGGWGYFMSRATPLTYFGESGRVQVLAK